MTDPDVQLIDAAPLRYLLARPASDFDEACSHPVLCFLHGYDEAAPLPIRQALTRHGPLAPQSAPEARSEFIVVAPQLTTAGDHWHRHADVVREIVEYVQDEHGGVPERTYLTGFSFGGNGVFDLALEQPGLWAALWAVDPTRVPPEDPGLPVWLSSGAVSRRGREAFMRRLHLTASGEAPAGERVYRDQGFDHAGTATAAYQDERIYRWLLSREQDAA